MKITELLILAAATWRIASLFVHEEGPGHIFRKLRERVGIKHNKEGVFILISDTFLAGVFSCVWCLSIYVGILWALLYLFLPYIALGLALPLALSALAVGFEKVSR